MDIDHPEFVIRELDDGLGVSVAGPRGEEVATFYGAAELNPAFLAFIEGLRKVPGVSVWVENSARYLVQDGKVEDDAVQSEIQQLLTPAAELRKHP